MGGTGFTLTLNGSGFTNDAAALWGSTALATTFVSATQLTAAVPAGLLSASGAVLVSVSEAAGISAALTFAVTNPIDLCALADVKSYLGIGTGSTSDDAILARQITGVSQYWLTRTCRSSLNSVQSFSERYNGNGKDTLPLRQWPIVSVSSLTVDALSVPASPDYIQPGWVIDAHKTALVIIGAGVYGNGFYAVNFNPGRLNVSVGYTAGYSATPWDVQDAAIKQVGIWYRRRKTLDEDSVTIPQAGGTLRHRSWEVPPEIERVIQAYRRLWP